MSYDIAAIGELSQRLHAAVAAVAPITGVSIGAVDDPATWRIDFSPAATDQQRAVALAILDGPLVTADQVRTEASRRMCLAFGARDGEHLAIIVSNASREAIRLLRIQTDGPWTDEQSNRAAELNAADALLEAIRAASNALEAMAPIPADYRNDSYWVGP